MYRKGDFLLLDNGGNEKREWLEHYRDGWVVKLKAGHKLFIINTKASYYVYNECRFAATTTF